MQRSQNNKHGALLDSISDLLSCLQSRVMSVWQMPAIAQVVISMISINGIGGTWSYALSNTTTRGSREASELQDGGGGAPIASKHAKSSSTTSACSCDGFESICVSASEWFWTLVC